jgi:hypothetical protein
MSTPLLDELDDLIGPGAERIPITVPPLAILVKDLAALSAAAQAWHGATRDVALTRFLTALVVVLEQTRVYLGDREP